MKKLWKTLFAALLVVPLFTGVFGAKTVSAAEATTTNVTINKRIWKDGEAPAQGSMQNTGEEMDFGGDPLEGAGFTAYDVTDAYLALIADGKSQAEATKEIADNASDYTTVAKAEQKTNANGQTTFEGLALKDGDKDKVYMFVETSTPGNVSVTTKAAPIVLAMPIYTFKEGKYSDTINTNVQVYPKNETKTDKKEVVDLDKMTVVADNGEKYYNITTGDVLNFKLTLNIPADIAEVKSYSVTDTPSEGLAYVDGTVKVAGLTEGTDYTVTKVGNGFKIDLINSGTAEKPVYTPAVLELAGKSLEVTYSMKLTATINPDRLQNNEAVVNIGGENQPSLKPKDPDGEIKFGTGGYKFVKKDSQSDANLAGAEFVVKQNGKYAEFAKNEAGEYVFTQWADSKTAATTVTSDKDGKFFVKGLKDGTYQLEETKTPSDKYVLLDKDINFKVVHGQYGEQKLETVKNTPKGLLPSTGGNGIYAFLLIGAALMIGAYAWFKKSKTQAEV